MAKIFGTSYLRPVYYFAGESNGQKFYRRAPFDVVVDGGKTTVVPRSIGPTDGSLGQLGIGTAEDQANWRENDLTGYEILQPIVINENQMGDGADNWMGLHSFSNI